VLLIEFWEPEWRYTVLKERDDLIVTVQRRYGTIDPPTGPEYR
jgi:hypothetical protein